MNLGKIVLAVGLLTAAMGFAEPMDMTVATPGVLKVKVTVLDRETEQPLPYVKMGLNLYNGTDRIVRALDLRTGADGVAEREVPYDSAGNIILDGAAHAESNSYANKPFNLVNNKGRTIDIDPVDAAGWNWSLGQIGGTYRVRRVVPGEGQYMAILGQVTHDNAALATTFSVETGATLHFKCWLQKPNPAGAHTVTYDTSLVQNANEFLPEQVNAGGTVVRTAATPVNAVWTTSTFTGWTIDGIPFDPASKIYFNLNLVPHWEGAEGEAFSFSDAANLRAGTELKAIPAEGLGSGGTIVYRWWRGTTAKAYESTPISTTDSYTPTVADYEHWLKFEMSVSVNGQTYPVGSREFFFSKLPVFYMTTNDGGNPTAAKEDHDGHLFVQGGQNYDSQYDGDFSIHVRGNSSATYPKLPYKIKLDSKTKMFGIAKNKHWVLLSNYLDPSLVRDKIAYDFAATIGNEPAVKSTWVDCVLNGEWIGCYLFCEHLRIDEKRVNVYDWEGAAEDCAKALVKYYPELNAALNGDRGPLEDLMTTDFSWVTAGKVTFAGRDWEINTTVWEEYSQDITGGYFFEMSEEYDSPTKWFVDRGGDFTLPMMINAPENLNSNAAMVDYCQNYWNQYWDAVRSSDGYALGKHWKELCKLNSMVTYWLTMEIFGNDDARQKSRFAYKDQGKKLHFGPVWDFDWGMGGATLREVTTGGLSSVEPTGWKVSWGYRTTENNVAGIRAFFREWIDDPLFCTRAYEKYHEFRTQMWNIVAEGGDLRQAIDYLVEAGDANSVRWPYKGQDFRHDTEDLRVYLVNRFAWLDQQFASVGTLMESLRSTVNTQSAWPYVRDEAKLPIAFLNTQRAPGSPETSVLHVAHEKGTDLEVSFQLGATATAVASVDTYLNGLKVGESVPVTAGQVLNVTIPPDNEEESNGGEDDSSKMDCVQFVARNANGDVVARNFALVTQGGEIPEDPIAQYCQECIPGKLKVVMKVMNKAGTAPLRNFSMQLKMTTSTGNRQPVAVGTTDEQGYLFIELPYDESGYIIQNGITSTTFNLTDVVKVDCDPVLSTYSWTPLTAGFVRNFPAGYSRHTLGLPEPGGRYSDAVLDKVDSDGDQMPDYIASGATLYLECYLTDNTGMANHTVTFDTAGMTPESAAAFSQATVAHNTPYVFPATVPENPSGRSFKGWKMTVGGASPTDANLLPGMTVDVAEGTESFTVAQNLTLTPVWGPNPNAKGIIKFRVHQWDHFSYWEHFSKTQTDDQNKAFGQTKTPIDGLTFVIKSYDSAILGMVEDKYKIPVGRENTPEGWAESRLEAHFLRYEVVNGKTNEVWDATYEISSEQLQYLRNNYVIDTDPDQFDLATYDRGLGWGPETVTFDWDWDIQGEDRAGRGLVGVRQIPESKRRGGNLQEGRNLNDVLLITQDMIDNGFEFTFECWVVPALVVEFDTDDGSPATYPEQRKIPVNSCSFWEQRYVVTNPGSPTRGAQEEFEGWYEVISTDANGKDVLANAPWNFSMAVEHSMRLKAVYRKTGYDVDPEEPAIIKVTGPGRLSFKQLLNNPNNDQNTRLVITVDGGEPVYETSEDMDGYEDEVLVFGGELDVEHVVKVSFETKQTGAGTSGNILLDQVKWEPYDARISDALIDRDSQYFEIKNLGTDPTQEQSGVTFFNGASQKTIAEIDETGRQKTSIVNPEEDAPSSMKGTEDYWYLNYDSQQNQLVPAGGLQAFAETPPTLSAGESTSFQVTGITGGSVIRWEALVADPEPGDAELGVLTVTVTFTPESGTPTTETHTYHADDFVDGQFKPSFLEYRSLPTSTAITLDFTYTNSSGGDGRAYVDNIYWKPVPPKMGEGVALMIVDHENADEGNVYLAFKPQFAPDVDPQAWFASLLEGKTLNVKKNVQRQDVDETLPLQVELSTEHESSIEKIWVKVPLSLAESGEFSQVYLGGNKPISYKREDGTMTDTTKDDSGATSVNTFGDLKVVTKTENTMVAVPWTWYSDQESNATSIPADKLVKTTNLEAGDCLYAYSGSGAYLGWTVEDQKGKLVWVPIPTVAKVGENSQVIVHDETGNKRTTLPRGVGVWLVRQNPTDKDGHAIPFWLYGQSVTTSASISITPKGANEDAHSTMLGNPYPVAVKINDLQFTGNISDGDTIVVPNGTDSPMYLEYRDTGTKRNPTGEKKWVWVHVVKSSSGLPKNDYDWDVTIPPGLAFWYVRRATGDLSVTWQPPQ